MIMNQSNVVPWKCHVCQREFDMRGGGLCHRCNKTTCRSHLNQVGARLKLEATWVCDDCLTEDERPSIKKWLKKLSELWRMRTGK